MTNSFATSRNPTPKPCSGPPERSPVGGRTGTHRTREMVAKGDRTVEADERPHPRHRRLARLQQRQTRRHPLRDHPPHRRSPRPPSEMANERTRRHMRPPSKPRNGQHPGQVRQGPLHGIRHPVDNPLIHHRSLNELRLPTLPMRRHDQPPRHRIRHRSPMITPHEMQTQIQTSSTPSTGQHIPVIDIKHPRVNPHSRKTLSKQVGIPPMRSGLPPIKQPRRRKRERPRTNRRHARPTRMCFPNGLHHSHPRPTTHIRHRRHDHRVSSGCNLQPMLSNDVKPTHHPHGLPRPLSTHVEAVPGPGNLRPSQPEHLDNRPELKRRHPRRHQHGNPMRTRNDRHGVILAMMGIHATSQSRPAQESSSA